MSNIIKNVISNGVRVLVEPVGHVKSAAIGLWCVTGSCHETEKELGITHFIEHMLFKGTERRTSKEIAEAIEGRGGVLNAFTDKETTCFYCRVLSDEVETGIDVLSDMITHSAIDPAELKREKGVVIEEIKRSQDEPSDYVHDLHLEERWEGHALGRSTLGTADSVGSIEREHITSYMNRQYLGPRIVLAATGNVDPAAILGYAESRLAGLSATDSRFEQNRPVGIVGSSYHVKDVEQVHFCMGTDGCSVYDDSLYTMTVLDAALGGGMSSRLFQEIREKRGLAYSVGSYGQSFSCGGAFTVYGGTSPEKWPLVVDIVREEFEKIRTDGLAADELDRTKRLLCGNIVLSLEGMSGRMMRMSKHEIFHQRDIPIEETLEKINAVTNEDIIRIASSVLVEDKVSITAIGPEEGVPPQ